MLAAPAAMPVNPNAAATNATTKKMKAPFNHIMSSLFQNHCTAQYRCLSRLACAVSASRYLNVSRRKRRILLREHEQWARSPYFSVRQHEEAACSLHFRTPWRVNGRSCALTRLSFHGGRAPSIHSAPLYELPSESDRR